MNDFFPTRLCSKIRLFLALVALGNCCHAYISIAPVGVGSRCLFSFFNDGEVKRQERRRVIIDFIVVDTVRQVVSIAGYGAMKYTLFDSHDQIVSGSMDRASGGGMK